MRINVKEKPSEQEKRTPFNENRISNYKTPVRDSNFNPRTYPVPTKDKPKKDK